MCLSLVRKTHQIWFFFHIHIKVYQVRYSVLFMVLTPCRALFSFLLAEHHWKRRVKEPTIRRSCQLPNVPSPEGHSWRVDHDGSFEFSGLVVKFTTWIDWCNDATGCEKVDDDDDDTTEADTAITEMFYMKFTQIRFSYEYLHWTGTFKLSCFNVKLSFLLWLYIIKHYTY